MNQNESMESLWNRNMGKFDQPTPPPFERVSNLSTVEKGISPKPPIPKERPTWDEPEDSNNEGFGEMIVEIFRDLRSLMRRDKAVRQLIWGIWAMFGICGAILMAKHVFLPLIFGR